MGNCWPKPVNNLPSSNKSLRSSISKNDGASVKKVTEEKKYPLPETEPEPESRRPPKTEKNNRSADDIVEERVLEGIPKTPKMFTYAELKTATRNFRLDTVLGEGGFGTVFRGWVDEKTLAPTKVGVGIAVAVKRCDPDSQQGLKEWQAEVKFLGKICHPNLVRLLGYCCEEKQFLLVYEYMQKRSLENHLFKKGETLRWNLRLRIAIDAARGLAFLHTTEKQVIYRDFKAANILLDGDFNAKLSDFGLAKLGPSNGDSHVTTQVVGTYGYAAPEYMATGHLYVKSDVYGFGVVLLEMISGRRVLDLNRPSGEHNLVDWAKPQLGDKRKLRKIMDSRLEGQYPSRAALQIAEVILKCLEPDPKNRPSMEEILEALVEVSTFKIKPNNCKQMDLPSNNRSPIHAKYPSGPSGGAAVARVHNHASVAKSY